MKISHHWLNQFLPNSLDPTIIADLLTSGGLEVEHVVPFCPINGGLEGLVIGEVLTYAKHPDADRLSVCAVGIGADTPLSIVCGAPNVAAGQKVVVAPVGTTVHPTHGEPFEIKKAKIRGQLSEGMICAEDEIGLGTSHEGILVLPHNAPVGQLAADYFKVTNDFIFEIGLTPNRTDAMSHLGVARDLRALLRSHRPEMALGEVQWPDVQDFNPTLGPCPIEVVVHDAEAAPRYVGLVIEGVKVGPSPDWLQNALKSIGLRPINNVVDVTNYVLHSIGQPLHAFDAGKIGGRKVVVRMAEEKEEFVTLDGVSRTLSGSDLMICDAQRPMCLAGVFGGLGTGVTEATTAIFLESAYFSPSVIRKAAKRHGLSTDASFRFERGVDPETVVYAAKWAALLIQQVAGGQCSAITDLYPNPIHYHKVKLSFARMDTLIGQHIPVDQAKSILEDLEIKIDKEKEGHLELMVPTYRFDVTREADVIEEILRIYGYNRIEGKERINIPIHAQKPSNKPGLREMVANRLSAMGFNEMMSNSLIPSGHVEKLFPDAVAHSVAILNPLSSDLNVLRQDLVFGAMEAVARNIRHQCPDLRLFEFGTVYYNIADGQWPFHEEEVLSITITGRAWPERWNAPQGSSTFYHLKGMIDSLLQGLGIEIKVSEQPERPSPFACGLVYTAGNKEVVRMGEVRTDVLKHFDIEQPVFYADIRFDSLAKLAAKTKVKSNELPKFPHVSRDLALLIDKTVTYQQLEDLAWKNGKGLLNEVTLFDVYEGKGIPDGKKSYAMRFILQDELATLTDSKIDDVMGRIVKAFNRELNAELRA